MSEGPRVALLTPYESSQRAGGVEVFNDCLRRALGGLETFADGGPEGLAPYGDLRRVGLEQPYGALRAARVLLRRHREEPFDVIVSNGIYGWPLTLAKPGVPLIQVYHFTMAGLARHALALRGDRWTTGHITAFFDRIAGIGKEVVAVSHRVLREVECFYSLRGRTIALAVDTDAFRPMDSTRARQALGLPLGAKIGMFVGRPDPTKGYDIVHRVARRMPEVLFLAAGGVGAGASNVRVLGHIAHEDMPRWYAACDFFFLPSRYEGFGLALLEALSSDLPAVLSEPAWPFIEEPALCGIVVRAGTDEEYAAAIRSVLSDRDRFSPREFIGPRYNLATFQRRWRSFIESVLGSAG